ncbi:hypothetical protein KI387_018626, partial [Taxus chinensis]
EKPCEAEAEKWWRKDTVAVVTGANGGIGLQIVRLLAEKGMTVVLTARRDEKQQLSEEARALLAKVPKNVEFHTLDVANDHSVAVFAQWLHKEFGGLDILINNAAVQGTEFDWDLLQKHNMDFRKILYAQEEDEAWASGVKENYESSKKCLDINYYGTVRTTKALLPLMKASVAGPRVVNVSSYLGLLKLLRSETLEKRFSDIENMREETIDSIINEFLEDIKNGVNPKENKWPCLFPTYSVSKAAMNAYTRLVARDMQGKVSVNSVHPGFVQTKMTFGSGDISPAEGAENVVRVALFPPAGPSGQFFLEKHFLGF